jgi:hypothetical protein
MTVIGVIVLLACASLWAGLVGNLLTLSASDPAGRGLAEVYAFFIAIVLWVLLGVLLLIAGLRGQMPSSAKAAALLLLPFSGAAVFAALALLQHQPDGTQRWPLLVPMLIPPLIMGYALWTSLPALRSAVPPGVAGAIAGGGILLLSLSPWPSIIGRARARSAIQARQSREETEEQEAAFARLSAESPLSAWQPFTEEGNPFRDRALAAIRGSPRRQADAESMMAAGYSFPMLELPDLALEPTPALCRSAAEFLRHEAEFFRTNNAEPTPFAVSGARIQRYLPAMEWLVAHRCDVDPGLAAIEAALREFPEVASVEHGHFLATVVRLRAALHPAAHP